jgi:hypothetical protein
MNTESEQPNQDVNSIWSNLPQQPMPFERWPGNSMCVSCEFFGGVMAATVEVVGVFALTCYALNKLYPRAQPSEECT